MNETLNFLIGELFLDTFNLDIVDHIKVNPKFLKYLEANYGDKILLEKSNEHPSGIIEKYKGVPVVVDYEVDDCYKLEFKYDCGFQQFVDVSSARKDNHNVKHKTGCELHEDRIFIIPRAYQLNHGDGFVLNDVAIKQSFNLSIKDLKLGEKLHQCVICTEKIKRKHWWQFWKPKYWGAKFIYVEKENTK